MRDHCLKMLVGVRGAPSSQSDLPEDVARTPPATNRLQQPARHEILENATALITTEFAQRPQSLVRYRAVPACVYQRNLCVAVEIEITKPRNP